jgi:hypothetical protein
MFGQIEKGVSCIRAATIAIAAIILTPLCTLGDSALVPAIPPQISVTALGTPLLMEGDGASVFGIRVKNTSSQAIGITSVAVALVKFGGPDTSDKVMSITQTNTTCPKNGLASNATCTFTFDVTPVGVGTDEDLNFGVTTATFTVTPNRGSPVSTNADFTVRDDHASLPEPASILLLATGMVALAGLIAFNELFGKQFRN